MLSAVLASPQGQHHQLTVFNNIAELDIVSLYIWGSGQSDKGDSWINTNLQPDSSATVSLPSGKCNILAFDELGNSYGIAGDYQKNVSDTIEIDLEYLTYGRPNVDHGHYILNLTNTLYGFALDTLILSSEQLDENIVIDNYRVFPGNNLIVWLNKGNYSVNAIDQIGRIYYAGSICIPSDSSFVIVVDSMLINTQPPIGMTGNGSESLIIENCLPLSVITELLVIPQNASDGFYLDNMTLLPGASIVLKLNSGNYTLTLIDNSEAEYTVSFSLEDSDIIRLPITYEYLRYDFSFPEYSLE